ncbi:MAG: fasciclin domain-containing protein [Planctomycetia bacterium]|nr:fasciclin domain-containing protein [Planctomycetia bacterium]
MTTGEEHKCVCHRLGRWALLAIILVLALGVLSWATMEQRKNIIKTAQEMKECETFVSCAEKAGLTGVLEKDGPFTVFIPTNEAFQKLSSEQLSDLLNNKSALTTLLLYHLIPQRMTPAEMKEAQDCMTCTVPQTAISCTENTYGKANCIRNAIPCTNGVIYLIDTVQIPPFLTDTPEIVDSAEISITETVPATNESNNPAIKENTLNQIKTDKKPETAAEVINDKTAESSEKTTEPEKTPENK